MIWQQGHIDWLDIFHKNIFFVSTWSSKEFFLKLTKDLKQLQKNSKIGGNNAELKQLLKALSEEQKLDDGAHATSTRNAFCVFAAAALPVQAMGNNAQ